MQQVAGDNRRPLSIQPMRLSEIRKGGQEPEVGRASFFHGHFEEVRSRSGDSADRPEIGSRVAQEEGGPRGEKAVTNRPGQPTLVQYLLGQGQVIERSWHARIISQSPWATTGGQRWPGLLQSRLLCHAERSEASRSPSERGPSLRSGRQKNGQAHSGRTVQQPCGGGRVLSPSPAEAREGSIIQ